MVASCRGQIWGDMTIKLYVGKENCAATENDTILEFSP